MQGIVLHETRGFVSLTNLRPLFTVSRRTIPTSATASVNFSGAHCFGGTIAAASTFRTSKSALVNACSFVPASKAVDVTYNAAGDWDANSFADAFAEANIAESNKESKTSVIAFVGFELLIEFGLAAKEENVSSIGSVRRRGRQNVSGLGNYHTSSR